MLVEYGFYVMLVVNKRKGCEYRSEYSVPLGDYSNHLWL